MHTLVRFTGFGCFIAFALACGSTGADNPGTGSGGASGSVGSGGNATGGSAPGTGSGGAPTVDSGGSGGAGGGRVITRCFNFDGDGGVEGWTATYVSSALGVTPVVQANVAVSLNTMDGQPAPGSLQVEIPYSAAGQYVGIGLLLPAPPSPGLDLRGKTLTAFVKIVSGLEDAADLPSFPGGAKTYTKSVPGYVYTNGPYTNVNALGTWIPVLPFDLMNPAFTDMTNDAGAPDPGNIYEIGLQIDTNGTTTTARPAVVLIDSVCY